MPAVSQHVQAQVPAVGTCYRRHQAEPMFAVSEFRVNGGQRPVAYLVAVDTLHPARECVMRSDGDGAQVAGHQKFSLNLVHQGFTASGGFGTVSEAVGCPSAPMAVKVCMNEPCHLSVL